MHRAGSASAPASFSATPLEVLVLSKREFMWSGDSFEFGNRIVPALFFQMW